MPDAVVETAQAFQTMNRNGRASILTYCICTTDVHAELPSGFAYHLGMGHVNNAGRRNYTCVAVRGALCMIFLLC